MSILKRHQAIVPLAANRRFTVAEGQPLLPFLLAGAGLKRGEAKNLLKFGAVEVNGRAVRQFDYPLSPGDVVTLGDLKAAAAVARLEQARIHPVYEDAELIAVDKPAGLLTVATDDEKLDTLFVRLNDYLQERRAGGKRSSARWMATTAGERAVVVHRLDRETSGLVLFAKSEEVKRQLQAAWPTVEKTYLAVIIGRPPQDEGTVRNYLLEDPKTFKVYASRHPQPGGQEAATRYRLLRAGEGLSLLELRLETGRKHQIRVHLAGLGCPVYGDRRYGGKQAAGTRLALHAGGLTLTHPTHGERLTFNSPLPKALERLVK